MRTADTGNGKVTFFVSDSAITFPCIFCGYCLLQEAKSHMSSKWVSECNNKIPILNQFWPDVSRIPVLLIVCISRWFDIRTRYTVELFSFVISGLWPLVNMFSVLAVTLRKTAEDSKHLMIISGLCAIEIKSKLFLAEICYCMWYYDLHIKEALGTFFSLKREHFSVWISELRRKRVVKFAKRVSHKVRYLGLFHRVMERRNGGLLERRNVLDAGCLFLMK